MLRMVLLVAVPLLAVSCSMMHEDYEPMPDMLGDSYVSVTVSAGSREATTRGPQGGEDGDGREDATENEYKISNLTLLLYKGGNNGINSTNNPTIEHAIYFSSFNVTNNGTGGYDNKTYSTFTKKLDDGIERAVYHVIAIANAGDKTSLKGQDLSDVRDLIITEQWKAAASINDYTDFVMTSEEDATIDMTTGEGSFDNPFEATIDVERLAARIDFDIAGGTYHSENGGYYEYAVEGSTTDKYRLKSIKVKKMLTSGSYLIKRVATDATATGGASAVYLGEEAVDNTTELATNYVLDPWTCSKTSPTEPDGLSYSDSDNISVKGEVSKIGTEEFFTLAYTQENTLPNADNNATYATALEFTGEYISNGTSKGVSTVTYYIRHCDPDNDAAEASPMKYGIVRNNIYRVKVSKVNKQDPATPDESPLLDLNIKVKKWHVIKHSDIVM